MFDTVQFGATLDLEPLDEEDREVVLQEIGDSDLLIGRAPGDNQYLMNTARDEDESIETVEIDKGALETLRDEAEAVIDSIDEESWHESSIGQSVHVAVEEANEVLEDNE